MYKFSNSSLRKLETCHITLQDLFSDVIKIYDITILYGHRDKAIQDQLFKLGKSKLRFPNSTHNKKPSSGIDVAPYPINWNDLISFYHLAGIVKGIAHKRGLKIRWGGDWDGDNDFSDQTFNDLGHFEIPLIHNF